MRVTVALETRGAGYDLCSVAGLVDLAPGAAGARAPDEVREALEGAMRSTLAVAPEVSGCSMPLHVLEGERLVADAGQVGAPAARDLRCEVPLKAILHVLSMRWVQVDVMGLAGTSVGGCESRQILHALRVGMSQGSG